MIRSLLKSILFPVHSQRIFNRPLLTLCILLLGTTLSAQSQNTATVSGTVKTTDGQAVELVTISIPELNRTTSTNEKGEFRIGRLPAGNFKLVTRFLSFQQQEQTIILTAGGTSKVNFVLAQSSQQLEAVNIAVAKANKYANKSTGYVARMPLANLENAQVYSSVSKELIAEQQVVDFKELLRNVPGVAPNNNPAGGTGATIRGFNATTTVRNGLAVQSYQSDPINIERVEVIKGPSATLFGSSIVGFGGLINQVTKKPFEEFKGEVGLTLGSYQLSRLTADINTPLNADKTALLRVNAAAHSEGSFQNYGHKRMYTFAPSFLYKASDRLTFLLEAEMNKTSRSTVAFYQNLQNTTYTNFKDIPVPFNISLGGENIDADLTANNFYAEAKYKISDEWTSTTSVAFGENRIEHSNQIYPQWTGNGKFNRSIFNYGPRIFTSFNAQQNFNGDFKFLGLRNRFLGGLNAYTFRSFLRFTNVGIYDQIDLNVSPNIPGINLEKVNTIVGNTAQTNTENNQRSYSAYASDVLNITDRLMAMLSLRVDRFENDAAIANGIAGTTGDYKQTAFSPKLGLVYEVLKDQVSVFGNYMNGFQNNGPVTQPDGNVLALKPRQANQWEGGFKLEAFNKKLSATFSYYDIKISNDTRIVNTFTLQDVTSKSKGFEAEVIANPVTGLNIIAGYATNNYKYRNTVTDVLFYQAQTPRNFANVWVSYKFMGTTLKNFGLGLGGNYVGDNYFDATNVVVIPSYTVVNATVFYDMPKWRFGIKGNNLGNKRYWTNYGIPETLRQVIGTLTFKF